MLSRLPGPLVFIISVSLTLLFTALYSSLILLVSLVKLLPIGPLNRTCSRLNNHLMMGWLSSNALVLRLTTCIDWQIDDDSQLRKDGWHLIISNHLSWADIVVLGHLFRDRLPAPKFFMKHGLIYIPLLGLACWGLDMPFMRRYSPAFLLKNPHLRGQDIKTTRRACEKFRHIPTTVINFVEGTRCTQHKRATSGSPYRHLMPPKAAGLAFTLATMGEQFDSLLNVTLCYPDNAQTPFKDLLMGRMKRILVRIEELPVDEALIGDYFNDPQFKRDFQTWLTQRWQEKDQQLEKWNSRR
ncbi:MAG: acyltransferase [Aeromonas sp.]